MIDVAAFRKPFPMRFEGFEVQDLDEKLRAALQQGFPELEEWTTDSTVRRMLRASQGNLSQAMQTKELVAA